MNSELPGGPSPCELLAMGQLSHLSGSLDSSRSYGIIVFCHYDSALLSPYQGAAPPAFPSAPRLVSSPLVQAFNGEVRLGLALNFHFIRTPEAPAPFGQTQTLSQNQSQSPCQNSPQKDAEFCLVFNVFSVDKWGKSRTEGFGFAAFGCDSPRELRVALLAPDESPGEKIDSFFVGRHAEIRDITGVAEKIRRGFPLEFAGGKIFDPKIDLHVELDLVQISQEVKRLARERRVAPLGQV